MYVYSGVHITLYIYFQCNYSFIDIRRQWANVRPPIKSSFLYLFWMLVIASFLRNAVIGIGESACHRIWLECEILLICVIEYTVLWLCYSTFTLVCGVRGCVPWSVCVTGREGREREREKEREYIPCTWTWTHSPLPSLFLVLTLSLPPSFSLLVSVCNFGLTMTVYIHVALLVYDLHLHNIQLIFFCARVET